MNAECSEDIEERITSWNSLLREQLAKFGSDRQAVTVMLFSSHQVLTEILDDPCAFDFTEGDPDTEGGNIWEDDLHLTSEVHAIFTERLLKCLLSSPPTQTTQKDQN